MLTDEDAHAHADVRAEYGRNKRNTFRAEATNDRVLLQMTVSFHVLVFNITCRSDIRFADRMGLMVDRSYLYL